MNKKTIALFFSIIMLLLLSACGGKEYKAALEKGYDNLEIQAYENAHHHFTEALKHKKKDEAKKGKQTAKIMMDGWDGFDAGQWDDAIAEATKIVEDESDDQSITIVMDDAKKLIRDAESFSKLEAELLEQLEEVENLIDEDKYKEAKKLLEEIIASPATHPALATLIEQAEELLEEVNKELETNDRVNEDNNNHDTNSGNQENSNDDVNNENNHQDENSNNNTNTDNENDTANNHDENNDEQNSDDVQTGLSKDEAIFILRNELQIPNEVNVNVDHVEGDYYIIQVFEVVGEGEGSHAATWGWYKLHKVNGTWEEIV